VITVRKSKEHFQELPSGLTNSCEQAGENKQSLLLALELNEVGVFDVNLTTNPIYRSPRYFKILGYAESQQPWAYENFLEHVLPVDRDMVDSAIRQSLSECRNIELEFRIIRRDQAIRWLWCCVNCKADTEGKISQIMGVLLDITERKMLEESLRESEHRYRTLFDSAGEAIMLLSGGFFIDCNSRTLEMFGCKRTDIIGKTPDMISPQFQPDGSSSEEKAIEKITAALTGHPQIFEWEHKRLNNDETFSAEVNLQKITIGGQITIMAIVHDITQRKKIEQALKNSKILLEQQVEEKEEKLKQESAQLVKAEQQLRLSESNYRALFENLLEAYVYHRAIFDQSGRMVDYVFLEVNRRFEIYTGLKNVIGQKVSQLIPDLAKTNPELFEIYGRVTKTGQPEKVDFYIGALDLWFSVSVYRPKEEHFIALFENITDRKKAELELKKQNEELETILETAPAPIFYKDRENRFVRVNKAFRELMGLMDEPLEGRSLFDLYPQQQAQAYWRDDQEVMSSGKPKLEIIEPIKTGYGERLLQVNKCPYRGPNGSIIGVIGFALDVTQRKQAEEKLKESEIRFKTIFGDAPEGMLLTDSNRRIVMANKSIAEMLGCRIDELIDKKIDELHPARDLTMILDKYHKLMGREIRLAHNIPVKRKDGNVFFADITGSPFNIDGKPYCLRCFRDNSLRRRAEEEIIKLNQDLSQRNQDLEILNQELETFNFSASHDLRTPLMGIEGFSYKLLQDYADKFDEQGKMYLERVHAGVLRMSALIDDLLNFSRVRKAEMCRETVDLSVLTTEIAAYLEQLNPSRKIEFIITPGIEVKGDHRLLSIAMNNLLNNAWKFTSKKDFAKIEFGKMENDGQITYFVRDNGAGFNIANQERLFVPFKRLHTSSQFPGSGLGLTIVQRVIQRHGGRIWATGEVEQGAVFYFTLDESAGI